VIGEKSSGSVNPVPTLNTISGDDDSDDDVDDSDDNDIDDDSGEEDDFDGEYCVYCGGKCDNCDYCLSHKQFEWNGTSYTIDLNQFNLTDEELTELFTKRDLLREEIANLQEKIEKMELSRNEDILLAIDELHQAINKITNNAEFNELLLSLKEINITEINSTFNELKKILETIKGEYPDEDFTEIDSLMENLETLLNEEFETYEKLTFELKEKLSELDELYEKYPFLNEYLNKSIFDDGSQFITKVGGYGDSKDSNKVLAGMKITGIPLFYLVLLILLSLIGLSVRRKF